MKAGTLKDAFGNEPIAKPRPQDSSVSWPLFAFLFHFYNCLSWLHATTKGNKAQLILINDISRKKNNLYGGKYLAF